MRTDITICEYCGKTKEGLSFMIGASLEPDWCMIEGTGKMSCPDCYEEASQDGSEAIQRHIDSVNLRYGKGGA